MLNLKIDSREKTVRCEVLLKGESEPLTLLLQQYEIVTEPAGTFLVVRQASASREWLTTILENFMRDRKIPVPAQFAGLLRMVA